MRTRRFRAVMPALYSGSGRSARPRLAGDDWVADDHRREEADVGRHDDRSRRRTGVRRLRSVCALFVLMSVLVVSVTMTGVASASDYPGSCPHGGHPGSTFCLNPNNGRYYTAAEGTWNNSNSTILGSNSGNPTHVNDEMWGCVGPSENAGN